MVEGGEKPRPWEEMGEAVEMLEDTVGRDG